MKEIATFEGAENGYEWGEIRFYSWGNGIAVDSQTGCSCNTYETPPAGELTWHRFSAVNFYAEVDAILKDNYWFTDAQRGEIKMAARTMWSERTS